jgi:hypothetical protein
MSDQSIHAPNWIERLGFTAVPQGPKPIEHQRIETAVNFFHEHFPPRPNETPLAYEKRTHGFLKGIDFDRDVSVRRLKKGEELIQYRYQAAQTKVLKQSGGKPGPYFSCPGTPQGRLGIAEGSARRRKFSRYEVVRSTNVLDCTASSTKDTWTNPKIKEVTLPTGKVRKVKMGEDVRGGGRQIIVPRSEISVRRLRPLEGKTKTQDVAAKRKDSSPIAGQPLASQKNGVKKLAPQTLAQNNISASKPRKGMRM